ncbi:hypothetical protein [Oceanicoccus sp. KOV_DT_Chl]|uniref:hypothetical protein n=1 Tax=Oceanicoccus sp. KOV_DT_Chl TaxID=1904639 RepID=UPI000C7CC272|nr:hypothetical protein [Oceanicoccus sp. KOV_DT_Chl]
MSETIEKYVAEDSLAYRLCWDSINHIVERFKMKEVTGEDGGAYHPIMFARGGKEVGEQRVWMGQDGVFKLVYVGLVANPPGVDSHMMFAFTDKDNPAPHYTVDSVHLAHMGHYAYHCEVMPGVDIGANLNYVNHVYEPLSEYNKGLYGTEGFVKSEELGLRQWAFMSPWMLAGRAPDAESFDKLFHYIGKYREHWAQLIENGIPQDCLEGVDMSKIADRDYRNRCAAFNRDVDPVYNQLLPLMGQEEGDRQIQVLRCVDGIEQDGDYQF